MQSQSFSTKSLFNYLHSDIKIFKKIKSYIFAQKLYKYSFIGVIGLLSVIVTAKLLCKFYIPQQEALYIIPTNIESVIFSVFFIIFFLLIFVGLFLHSTEIKYMFFRNSLSAIIDFLDNTVLIKTNKYIKKQVDKIVKNCLFLDFCLDKDFFNIQYSLYINDNDLKYTVNYVTVIQYVRFTNRKHLFDGIVVIFDKIPFIHNTDSLKLIRDYDGVKFYIEHEKVINLLLTCSKRGIADYICRVTNEILNMKSRIRYIITN